MRRSRKGCVLAGGGVRPGSRGGLRRRRFAAPDRAVGAVAGAVPGEAQHRAGQIVLGYARRHVRVMMLHAQ